MQYSTSYVVPGLKMREHLIYQTVQCNCSRSYIYVKCDCICCMRWCCVCMVLELSSRITSITSEYMFR
jgi:hypothetical protein